MMPAEERWRTYRDDEVIADPCLFEPVPVRALLDAVEADDAVAQALLDKGNRAWRARASCSTTDRAGATTCQHGPSNLRAALARGYA